MSSGWPDGGPRRASTSGASRPGDGWRRSPFGRRLALGYAGLFAASAAALLGLAYVALGVALERQDAAYLADQVGALARVHAADGLVGVRRHAARLQDDDRGEEVLVRLTAPDGAVRFVALPDEWTAADLAGLEARRVEALVLENARERQTLEARGLRLPTGDVLQVGISSDERDDVLEAFPRVVPFVALPLVLLALLGGGFMASRALRPVRRLVATLETITATGDVRARAPETEARGELADLLRLFNRSLDRVEALVGRLRATLDDVAHDLRTPLTALRGTAEVALRRDREPEAYRAALARVVEAAEDAQATLDSVLEVAEAEAGIPLDLGALDLDAAARDVAELYALVAEDRGVGLDVEAGGAGTVRADGRRLRRALAHLVDNAVKYTPPGGRVTVSTAREGLEARVEVRDTGVGIATEELPRIWDRLYRSERTRHERGLGLGLALAKAIVEAHGGRLEARSVEGEGATFTVVLPADLSDP